jgi:protein subunit release factor B
VTPIDSTLAPHEREIEEWFVRASGPGGQNVNKVATAVELRFDVGASSLSPTCQISPGRACRQPYDNRRRACTRQPGMSHTGTEPRRRSGTSRRSDSASRRSAQDAQGHEAEQGRQRAATDREETASRCEGPAEQVPRRQRVGLEKSQDRAQASFQVIRSGKEPPPVGHELSTTQHSIWGSRPPRILSRGSSGSSSLVGSACSQSSVPTESNATIGINGT